VKHNQSNVEDLVKRVLESTVPELQIRSPQSGSRYEGADLVANHPGQHYVVKISYQTTVRIPELIGSLAASTLVARRIAQATPANPLILAVAPRIGAATVKKVEEFMSLNAHDMAWGLMDFAGTVRLLLPSLDIDIATKPPREVGARRLDQQYGVQLFSDLNRWLLKVMLLQETPQTMWGGPRERIDNPTILSKIANVSTAKAHRFFQAFKERNFLKLGAEGLMVTRRGALINAWLTEETLQSRKEMPTRCLFDQPSSIFDLVRGKTGVAIGGFEACRLHGVLHTQSPYPVLHVTSEFGPYLESLELVECEFRDAQLVLMRSRYPESIFRGATEYDRLPVVDILQAALDVMPLKPSGAEQASFIVQHVLNWEQ